VTFNYNWMLGMLLLIRNIHVKKIIDKTYQNQKKIDAGDKK
jgi:hypothetical protein